MHPLAFIFYWLNSIPDLWDEVIQGMRLEAADNLSSTVESPPLQWTRGLLLLIPRRFHPSFFLPSVFSSSFQFGWWVQSPSCRKFRMKRVLSIGGRIDSSRPSPYARVSSPLSLWRAVLYLYGIERCAIWLNDFLLCLMKEEEVVDLNSLWAGFPLKAGTRTDTDSRLFH